MSNRPTGPAWLQRLGMRSVLELQRAYFGQAGNVNFEDLAVIAATLPGFKAFERLSFYFTTSGGEIEFRFPPFESTTSGPMTAGTTEVRTLGTVESHEIDSVAIMYKDKINAFHQKAVA